jgi:hypothetical protein
MSMPISTGTDKEKLAWVVMWAEQSIWLSFVRSARIDKKYAYVLHELNDHKRCYHG